MELTLRSRFGGASRTALAGAMLAGLTALAFGQAGGPDYFRIKGLKKEDNVNVRRTPDTDARIVGKIRKDSNGIKNLGCRGGVSLAQWEKFSEEKKKTTPRARWCQVSHGDVKGWVLGRFLAEGEAPPDEAQQAQAPAIVQEPARQPERQTPANAPIVAGPLTVDCAALAKPTDKLICSSPALLKLVGEVGRLYASATATQKGASEQQALESSQQNWVEQRNTCFDEECVAELAARRIHRLRSSYAAAQENTNLSTGPLLLRCENFPLPIMVSFISAEPGYAYLEWLGASVVIPQIPSASGARYEGNFAKMHTKGEDAILRLPSGKMDMQCKIGKSAS